MMTMAGLMACSTALAAPLPPDPLLYALTTTVKLGAPDHWDTLAYAEDTQRLFVAHGTQITVLATSSARLFGRAHAEGVAVIGSIGGFDGAHGVALVPGGFGYAASGKAGTVIVFDQDKLKAVKTIAAGPGPDALAYDGSSRHLFVMNGEAGRITVIDTRSNTVTGSIATGGKLEFAAADGQGGLFVNQTDTGSLLRIDTATNSVSATWKLPDCDSPHGVAVDPYNRHVFVSCLNAKMLVVSGGSGRIVAQTVIGHGSDTVAYDPERHLVFSSNGDGTLSALSAVSLEALQPLQTAPGARTMAVDPVSGRIFLVTADMAGDAPAAIVNGWPKLAFKPDSVKLLVLSPGS